MVKIIDEADSGKTRKLLTACSEDEKALFVCAHPYRVAEKCKAYGINPVNSMGYEDFIAAKTNKDPYLNDKHIYIDELLKFVQTFTGVEGISMTID